MCTIRSNVITFPWFDPVWRLEAALESFRTLLSHPGRPCEAPGASKKEGSPPKNGFFGGKCVYRIASGGSKIAFCPPRDFLRGFGPPKMALFWLQNMSGSENRDFVKMWLFLRRQHDFEDLDPPERVPKSIPGAV